MFLKTAIDIPIIIFYMIKLQHLKFGLWVDTSNLQTSIWLNLSKKRLQIFSYGRWNWGRILWIGLGEIILRKWRLKVGILLLYAKIFVGFGLIVGSSFLLDPILNVSPDFHALNGRDCTYWFRVTRDLGLGTLCELAINIHLVFNHPSQYFIT